MEEGEDESRLIATCVDCGSVYAALELPDGEIQPIGSRRGCTSCGGTEFTSISSFSGGSGAIEADDDDD